MRHDPVGVHAVAGEAAAELVVHPAAGHRLAASARPSRSGPASARCARGARSRNSSTIDGGNLGAPPKPPRAASKSAARSPRRRERRPAWPPGRAAAARGSPARHVLERSASTSCWPLSRHLGAPAPSSAARGRRARTSVNDGIPVCGPAGSRCRQKNGATCGVEEHRHRPAALPGQRLGGLHVDGVDVRTLLAVHLDADEALVHQRGRRRGPRRTRAPSRGTSGRRRSRPRAGRVRHAPGPRRRRPRPRATSRPGCRRAGAGRGTAHRPDDWSQCRFSPGAHRTASAESSLGPGPRPSRAGRSRPDGPATGSAHRGNGPDTGQTVVRGEASRPPNSARSIEMKVRSKVMVVTGAGSGMGREPCS